LHFRTVFGQLPRIFAMKSPQFPLTIRRGSSTVKIYREAKASGTYYRISFYKGGKRCAENFRSLEEARLEAEAKAAQLSRGDLDALQLTGRDRLIYGRALEAVRPHGIALDAAAIEWAETKRLLGSFSFTDVARFYLRHHGENIRAIAVADAVAEMIAAKTEKGLSAVYLADLKYRLGVLAEAFHCDVSQMIPDDVRAFFSGLKLSPRSFNNTLSTISTFFTYAQDRGWLSKEIDLLAGIEKRREKAGEIAIYTSADIREILAHASLDIRPCLALAAFAGLRSEEILRLDWADIERRPGYVEVSAGIAKTAARRLVPVQPSLQSWLGAPGFKQGKVWPHSKPWYFESIRDTVRRLNKSREQQKRTPLFKWKSNALRHSFISYRVAQVQNVNQVALEAGNSPRVIFANYRELVTPRDAGDWFGVKPFASTGTVTEAAA
jgi:integrase